jgi:hypothetical protein
MQQTVKRGQDKWWTFERRRCCIMWLASGVELESDGGARALECEW